MHPAAVQKSVVGNLGVNLASGKEPGGDASPDPGNPVATEGVQGVIQVQTWLGVGDEEVGTNGRPQADHDRPADGDVAGRRA